MAIKTNKSDVIANFVRYHGRQPNQGELAPDGVIEYLTTKAPNEVESLLAKDSKVTGGLLWKDFNAGGQTQAPSTNADGEINPGTAYAVNNIYQKYFNRPADTTELNHWATKTLEELDFTLKSDYQDATKHPYDGSPVQKNTLKSLNDLGYDEGTSQAIAEIEQMYKDGIISYEIKEVAKLAIEDYPDGLQFDPTVLMETFNNIRKETIDPHFQEVIDFTTADLQNTLDYIEATQDAERQSEIIAAQQNLDTATANLEASGMTFSGEGIKQLGTQSAYQTDKEGRVQAMNRLTSTSREARRQASINQLGLGAEEKLGSVGATALGINGYNSLGGVKGSIEDTKQGTYGQTLQQLLSQQQTKNQLNTNLQYN